MSLEDNSVILSECTNNNMDCDITLGSETPKPILASTAQKQRNKSFQRSEQRESFIPVPKNYRGNKRTSMTSSKSSESSKNESLFKDDSSLSILDLNDLPDARKSVSLVHVSDKASSIGSWLDHCFDANDNKENEFTSNHPLHRGEAIDLEDLTDQSNLNRPSEIPTMECGSMFTQNPMECGSMFTQNPMKTPFDARSCGSDDSEFEFNEDELDIDVLINEDDDITNENDDITNDMDSTMKGQQLDEDKDTNAGDGTTLDFLKGIGFPLPRVDGNDSTFTGEDASMKLDSKYFAAAKVQSELSINASIDQLSDGKPSLGFMSVEEGATGKFPLPRTSTKDEPFDTWQSAPALNFSGNEFMTDSGLQQQMFGGEDFQSNADALAMFEEDEAAVQKEHEFSINSEMLDHAHGIDFSVYRTSMLTIDDQDEEQGKVSIGTYMAGRSGKLGRLDGKIERPSFGFKVRTPSPQKPISLVAKQTIMEENEEQPSLQEDKLESCVYTDTMLSNMAIDETVDQTMMESLSKAISNMSTNMNNEDIAKFIVAFSNKKAEEKKQNKQTFVVAKDGKPMEDSVVKVQHKAEKSDISENNSTLKSDETMKELTALGDSPSMRMDDTTAVDGVVDKTAPYDELPSLNQHDLLSPDSIASRFLSSTRLNLSLTRGSLSRESIEELHRKLRGDFPQHVKGKQKQSLPDVVTPQSTGDKSCAGFKSISDPGKAPSPPISQSSPEEPPKRVEDGRLSSMFHPLHPSSSFHEMPTLSEDDFNEKQLGGGGGDSPLDEKEEAKRSSLDSKEEMPSCVEPKEMPSCVEPKASSTRSHDGDFNNRSNLSSRSGRSRLSDDIVCPYPSLPTTMGNYDFYGRQHLVSLPPMPGHQIAPSYPDGRNFDSTIYSTRSLGFPQMYPQPPILGGRISGGYPQDIYFEGPQVSIPQEITHDKTMCTGVPGKVVVPVKNNSPRWIQIELRTMGIVVNNRSIMSGQENYVSLKRKHVIGPHSLEHCEVIITSNEAGHCHIIIEVLSHLIAVEGNSPHDPRCTVSPTNIHANIDSPNVIVYGSPGIPQDKKGVIDFGEIVCGSTKAAPLRILNRGRSEIPIRALLFTNSHERSCFSLSLSSTLTNVQETSVGTMAMLRLVLPPSDQPITIWIHFHSPMKQFTQGDPPEKVKGRVEVTLDIPAQSSPQIETSLDAIGVQAVVGSGKLHAPRRAELFVFKTNPGGKQTQKFPVKNVGNISVQVNFTLDSEHECFTIRPSSALLPPSGELNVSAEFHPPLEWSKGPKPFTTLLLMTIQPSGPQFEVKFTSTVSATPTSATPTLLTNKTRLRWGGVLIGSSNKQKLMLKRSKVKEGSCDDLRFRASIKSDESNSFQIVTMESGCEELCTRSDMEMTNERSIFISFAPCRRKVVHAKLEIKTPIDELPATKYTIPLMGYGGTSDVQIEASKGKDGVHTLDSEKGEVTVKNAGTRSAFVKITVYRDATCTETSRSVSCSANCFVLNENQSKTMSIVTLDNQAAFVRFWHGDELSRQLMRKVVKQNPSLSNRCIPESNHCLRSMTFVERFDGEDETTEESSKIEPHSYDAQIFYNNIKFSDLKLSPKQPDIVPSYRPLGVDMEQPERDVGFTESSKPPKSSFSPNWEVSPTHITVETPKPRGIPGATRVKIVNNSSTSLMYDVVWPGHYITITPNRGRVEPESVAVLLISANPSLSTQPSLLPWCGQAMVVTPSGDEPRVIHVQIKSPESQSKTTLDQSTSDESAVSDTSSASQATPSVRVSKNAIEFGDVVAGSSSKSVVEFRNMSKADIKWSISSFAPAYVKNNDSSGDIHRSTYAVFVLSLTSGRLESGARMQVPITFNPMHTGVYTQHWGLGYHFISDVGALGMKRDKIQLTGKGVKPGDKPASQAAKPNRGDIYLSKDHFSFPPTKLGSTKTIKIPVKNRGKSAHTVKFINLSPPFHITHQKYTIRAMHCANLPVNFKPTNHGSFTGTLVVQSESGDSIRASVSGNAV